MHWHPIVELTYKTSADKSQIRLSNKKYLLLGWGWGSLFLLSHFLPHFANGFTSCTEVWLVGHDFVLFFYFSPLNYFFSVLSSSFSANKLHFLFFAFGEALFRFASCLLPYTTAPLSPPILVFLINGNRVLKAASCLENEIQLDS